MYHLGEVREAGGAYDAKREACETHSTQVIMPALWWIEMDLKVGDLKATVLKAKNLASVDVLVGKDGSGKFFCVGPWARTSACP